MQKQLCQHLATVFGKCELAADGGSLTVTVDANTATVQLPSYKVGPLSILCLCASCRSSVPAVVPPCQLSCLRASCRASVPAVVPPCQLSLPRLPSFGAVVFVATLNFACYY
jgi:hypothetical protein